MSGYNAVRETWKMQWGPEPVLALQEIGAGARRAPVTLAGAAGAVRRRGWRGQD